MDNLARWSESVHTWSCSAVMEGSGGGGQRRCNGKRRVRMGSSINGLVREYLWSSGSMTWRQVNRGNGHGSRGQTLAGEKER